MNTGSVLVTGASGFVGRVTVEVFIKAGWKVTRGQRNIPQAGLDGYLRLDLDDPIAVLKLADTNYFDAIVHLAAQVDLSGNSNHKMYVPNVLTTACLSELAKQWGSHVTFASSVSVYGVRNKHITGASSENPDTEYARTKWLGEQLFDAAETNNCALRIAGIFGRNGPDHLGLNQAIHGALEGNRPTVEGTGSALRNYVYVKDVADTIVYATEYQIIGKHLLAGNETLSVAQMLDSICSVFLPGQMPNKREGVEGINQVIRSSTDLPSTRTFMEALQDIKAEVSSK